MRGVVLDKDGTLFDAHATWAGWARGFVEREGGGDPGLRVAMADVLGFDLAAGRFVVGSAVLTEPTPMVAERLAALRPGWTPADVARRMEVGAAGTPQVEAAPLGPLLRRLRRMGLAVGLVTNDDEASARGHLAAAGVARDFGFVAGWDSGHGAKPEPGPLLAFGRWAGLPPDTCVMVGDGLPDLLAARAAGMAAVAVLTGAGDREALRGADAVLPSVAALPAWIAERNRQAAACPGLDPSQPLARAPIGMGRSR